MLLRAGESVSVGSRNYSVPRTRQSLSVNYKTCCSQNPLTHVLSAPLSRLPLNRRFDWCALGPSESKTGTHPSSMSLQASAAEEWQNVVEFVLASVPGDVLAAVAQLVGRTAGTEPFKDHRRSHRAFLISRTQSHLLVYTNTHDSSAFALGFYQRSRTDPDLRLLYLQVIARTRASWAPSTQFKSCYVHLRNIEVAPILAPDAQ
jgi:hypothetical protein